jgi:ABC-type phosphate/phosphonate transport system substrate-binding protein
VTAEVINPQTQTRVTWADSPDVAQAYLDQLTRMQGVDAALATRSRAAIDGWRQGSADRAGAAGLAASLTTAASAEGVAAPNKARLTALAGVFERMGG